MYENIINFKINEDLVNKDLIIEVKDLLKKYFKSNEIFDFHENRNYSTGVYLDVYNDYIGCIEFYNGIEQKRYSYSWEEIKSIAKDLNK